MHTRSARHDSVLLEGSLVMTQPCAKARSPYRCAPSSGREERILDSTFRPSTWVTVSSTSRKRHDGRKWLQRIATCLLERHRTRRALLVRMVTVDHSPGGPTRSFTSSAILVTSLVGPSSRTFERGSKGGGIRVRRQDTSPGKEGRSCVLGRGRSDSPRRHPPTPHEVPSLFPSERRPLSCAAWKSFRVVAGERGPRDSIRLVISGCDQTPSPPKARAGAPTHFPRPRLSVSDPRPGSGVWGPQPRPATPAIPRCAASGRGVGRGTMVPADPPDHRGRRSRGLSDSASTKCSLWCGASGVDS